MGTYALGTVGASVLEPESAENFQSFSIIRSVKDAAVCQVTSSSSVCMGSMVWLTGEKKNNSLGRNTPGCLARPGVRRSKRLDTFHVSSRPFKRLAFRNDPAVKPILNTKLLFHTFWAEQLLTELAASESGR